MNIVKSSNRLMMAMSIAILLLTAGCAATTTPTGANSATKTTTKTTTTKTTAAVRQLDWTIPVVREDGTALPLDKISGYKIYYGTRSGDYTDSLNLVPAKDSTGKAITDYNLASLPHGTYYFTMTTVDTAGRESLYSNEVKAII